MSWSGPRSESISFPVVTGWMPNSRSATSNANWLFLAQSASFRELKSLEEGTKRGSTDHRSEIKWQIRRKNQVKKILSGGNAIPLNWESVFSQSASLANNNICQTTSHRMVWWLDELIYNFTVSPNHIFLHIQKGLQDLWQFQKCENYFMMPV